MIDNKDFNTEIKESDHKLMQNEEDRDDNSSKSKIQRMEIGANEGFYL